jgi:hypothetical protein
MNVFAMSLKVLNVANAMVRESSLPYLPAPELETKRP